MVASSGFILQIARSAIECYSVAIVIRGPHNLDSIVMFKETLEVATTITSRAKIKCKYVKFIFTFQRKYGSIYL